MLFVHAPRVFMQICETQPTPDLVWLACLSVVMCIPVCRCDSACLWETEGVDE